MKVILTFLFLVYGLCSYAQPIPVKIRKLNYFYIDKSITLQNGLNCIVVTEQKMFERMFGKSNRADTPRFASEMLLVLLMPASNRESTLTFERVTMQAGDFVEVYCGIDLNHHKIPYTQNSIAVAAIPKYRDIRKVKFYNEKKIKLLDEVEVKD